MPEELGKSYTEENAYYYNGNPIIDQGRIYEGDSPTVVELFCGCGGTSLGFEKAGYEILMGVDIHKPSIETFKRNHPNASTILGDIRKVTPKMVRRTLGRDEIDVLIGGVPCQGFSLNNKKRNSDDRRNFLYLEFMRFVRDMQPRIIVIENVSGMRSTGKGEFVQAIKQNIENSGNYRVVSDMLNAADFGVPQKRQRLVFVGVRDGNPFNFADMIKTNGPETNTPYVTVNEAIGDLPSLSAGHSSTRYLLQPQSPYQVLMRQNVANNELTCHIAPNHPAATIAKIRNTPQGEPMYPKFKQRIRLDWTSQSPTQVSGGIRPQFQFGHPIDDRGLTIRERCRLQSFPDDFVVTGGIVQGRVQTGNAVPPLLAQALATALIPYVEGCE